MDLDRLPLRSASILCGATGRRAAAGPLDEISIPEMRDKVIRTIEGSDRKAPAPRTETERKEDYRRGIERRMDWLDGRIHQLKLDAARKGRDSKERLDGELPDLQKQREAARQKLMELEATSGSSWHKLKEGVETAVQKLEDTVNRAGSRI
jgi:hypothetical protein